MTWLSQSKAVSLGTGLGVGGRSRGPAPTLRKRVMSGDLQAEI